MCDAEPAAIRCGDGGAPPPPLTTSPAAARPTRIVQKIRVWRQGATGPGSGAAVSLVMTFPFRQEESELHEKLRGSRRGRFGLSDDARRGLRRDWAVASHSKAANRIFVTRDVAAPRLVHHRLA